MKKKYYFLVFILVLVIFFITNFFIASAKMYKILDSEGNVIGFKSQPFLSASEKEAGYTLDSPARSSKDNPNLTEGLTNWGEFWDCLSIDERIVYCVGMRDGIRKAIFDCVEWMYFSIPNSAKSQLPELDFVVSFDQYLSFLSSDGDVVIKVVTSLYMSLANTYIIPTEIFFIAYQKIQGKDIEPLLQEARKEAFQKQQ